MHVRFECIEMLVTTHTTLTRARLAQLFASWSACGQVDSVRLPRWAALLLTRGRGCRARTRYQRA